MKKIIGFLAALVMLAAAGCGQQASSSQAQPPVSSSSASSSSSSSVSASSESTPAESASLSSSETSASSSKAAAAVSSEAPEAPAQPETPVPAADKTLVIYFSGSGNTRAVAETISGTLNADIYELVPEEPYTSADLDWTNENSRVNTEHNNPSHRTAIAGGIRDLKEYGTIFLGYPLWWRQAPSIVWNFVENADLAGKTMIPFCTSTSDDIGDSGTNLAAVAPNAHWLEGTRFGERLNASAVTEWVNSLTLVSSNAETPVSAQPAAADSPKVLVAYFSVPEDVDTSDVDAIAGASVLVSNGTTLGNIEFMAGIIQRETGADSYRIVEQNAYPRNHEPLIEQAQQEQRNNDRPAIAGQLPDLSSYDVIFLGYPNWWGDMPMILYTFLDSVDLSGKTVVPFCVHGGSGFSNTVQALRESEPNASIMDGLTISRNSIADAEPEIVSWVNSLAIHK